MKQSHIHFFRAISHKFNFATSSSNSDKAATGNCLLARPYIVKQFYEIEK